MFFTTLYHDAGCDNNYREEYVLEASELLSKWGFEDGDICDHELLIYLVRKHLQPLLDERVELEEIVTCHNPIRATIETRQYVDESISVKVKYPDWYNEDGVTP